MNYLEKRWCDRKFLGGADLDRLGPGRLRRIIALALVIARCMSELSPDRAHGCSSRGRRRALSARLIPGFGLRSAASLPMRSQRVGVWRVKDALRPAKLPNAPFPDQSARLLGRRDRLWFLPSAWTIGSWGASVTSGTFANRRCCTTSGELPGAR